MPSWEQEERRRTFWSVYLLDQLISVGPNRLQTFLDADCSVHLPCHEITFRDGSVGARMVTLEDVVENPTPSNHQNLDHFAMTILMASALGRFIRSSLKRSPYNIHPPWDSRSKFHSVHSILLHFESYSPCTFSTVAKILDRDFTVDGVVDRQRAGHFIYSHALFHLNHCLLNHPFVLHHYFLQCSVPIPLSFVQEALQRCHKHAKELLDLLTDVQKCGSLVESSFYGFCALTPGLIHRLYTHHEDIDMARVSKEKVQVALDFLTRQPVRWTNQSYMVICNPSFSSPSLFLVSVSRMHTDVDRQPYFSPSDPTTIHRWP